MKIASPKLHIAHVVTNDEALRTCQAALEEKDKGDYKRAENTMRRLWKGVGTRPNVEGLDTSVAAEVFLCVGILTGWIGSKTQAKDVQETAKNLISESITLYESIGDLKNVAVARTEIAYCYFRKGELNEARDMLRKALERLATEGLTRARALLKLTTVEHAAARYHEALRILDDNASLFQKIRNHTTRGTYYSEFAIVLWSLATSEKNQDYLRRAIDEYEKADREFKLAKNVIYRAAVKNNVGILLLKLSRYKDAHQYLNEARRLTVSFKDKTRTAQIDDTLAQVFIAQGKPKEAEAVARRAVWSLEKSGHRCMVAEALITQGIALARSGKKERAQFIFQRAIEVALQVDAVNIAGLAALTLIEEVDQLSPATLQAAYQQAREWLEVPQSQDVLLRLNEAAEKLASLRGELSGEEATEILLSKGFDLHGKVLEYERSLISQALAQANGRVTHAAALLRLTYQGLAYIIQARHPDLLKERTPVRRRGRKPTK